MTPTTTEAGDLRALVERVIDEFKERGSTYTPALAAAIVKALTHQPAHRSVDRKKVAALEWYAKQVADCRKVQSEGEAARVALDADGGKRARDALTPLSNGTLEPVLWPDSTDWQCPNCHRYQYKVHGFECDECGYASEAEDRPVDREAARPVPFPYMHYKKAALPADERAGSEPVASVGPSVETLCADIETRLLGVRPDDQDLQLEDDDWRLILKALRGQLRPVDNEGREPGCEVCGGDCGSANPPMIHCPMRDASPQPSDHEAGFRAGVDLSKGFSPHELNPASKDPTCPVCWGDLSAPPEGDACPYEGCPNQPPSPVDGNAEVEGAVAAEREACARIAKIAWLDHDYSAIADADVVCQLCEDIAERIRDRAAPSCADGGGT